MHAADGNHTTSWGLLVHVPASLAYSSSRGSFNICSPAAIDAIENWKQFIIIIYHIMQCKHSELCRVEVGFLLLINFLSIFYLRKEFRHLQPIVLVYRAVPSLMRNRLSLEMKQKRYISTRWRWIGSSRFNCNRRRLARRSRSGQKQHSSTIPPRNLLLTPNAFMFWNFLLVITST